MTRRRARAWLSLAAAAALVSAACGTTVDPALLAAAEQNPNAGLGPGGDLGSDTPRGGPGGTPGGDGTSGPGGAGLPGGPLGGPPGPGAPAIGVTADTISIGVIYTENQSEANAALGATGISGGEGRRYDEIVIEDLNARGGIAGRKVEPVWASIDALSNETEDAQLEAVCSRFTEDHTVYAALGGGNSPTFAACMERAGAIVISTDLTESDERTFQRFPHYIEGTGAPNLNRMAEATVHSLWRNGYFSGWNPDTGTAAPGEARIGVLTYDDSEFDYALERSLLPALASHGLEAAEVRQVKHLQRLSDASEESAEVSSAVLRFKTQRITHVILLEASGTMLLFFTQAAQGQGYRPRYGLNTQSGNSALAGSTPPGQLNGALSIGWNPDIDLSSDDAAKLTPSSSRRRCVKLMEENGVTFDSTNAQAIAVSSCDSWWLLEAAVERAVPTGGAILTDSFLTGLHALGSSWVPAGTFATRFGPTQHDGVAAVADMAFVPECTCFRYRSAPYSIP